MHQASLRACEHVRRFPTYEAIEINCVLSVEGKALPVTTNLHLALLLLRSKYRSY